MTLAVNESCHIVQVIDFSLQGGTILEELVEAERLWVVDPQAQLNSESNFKMWQKQFDLFSDDKWSDQMPRKTREC